MPKHYQQFLDLLEKQIVVADGATGTMLQAAGVPTDQCVEEWNLSHADVVRSLHQSYYHAGSDFVETNTFGGNRIRLQLHGLGERVADINRLAVEHVRSVCPDNKFVAGSVGPTGEYPEPIGTITYDALYDVFLEQAAVLIESGVDLILVETMTDLTEMKAAINAVKNVDSEIPLLASMTFDNSPGGFHTMMGITPRQAAEALTALNVNAFGSNCGSGSDQMYELIPHLKQYTALPIIVQSNAGIPVWQDDKHVFPETPQERARNTESLLQLGVRIVGGCCGTTPEHIRMIRTTVDKFQR